MAVTEKLNTAMNNTHGNLHLSSLNTNKEQTNMKKSFAVIIFLSASITTIWAQKISMNTLTTAGDYTKNKNGVSVSWTIGEVFSQTITNDHHVTEGFQQGALERQAKVQLTATRQDASTVILEWQATGTIEYTGGFYVQRRFEGEYEFQSIAFIKGENNKHGYLAIDANTSSKNTFYRIEYLNNNNSLTTNIEAVKGIPVIEYISVYPNPVVNQLNIRFKSDVEDEISIQIFDQTGRTHIPQDLFPVSNQTYEVKAVNDLPTGIYIINVIKNGSLLGSKQFVKS